MLGSHIATLPFKVLQQMIHHPLTDKGIKTFREDWDKARKSAQAKDEQAVGAAGFGVLTQVDGASDLALVVTLIAVVGASLMAVVAVARRT